jgi:hypothetical protein
MEGNSMVRQLSLLLGSTALAAMLSLAARADGPITDGIGAHSRGLAVLPPVESPDTPGLGVKSAHGGLHHWNETFTPYYSSPLTPISNRWRVSVYAPYYRGYCLHHHFGPKPPPYGSDGWGPGPGPNGSDGSKLNSYGIYTSVLKDDTIFWRMGGNGLVPYGTPRPPHSGPPDIVDMIQDGREQGGSCGSAPVAALAAPSVAAGPAIMPPAEKTEEKPATPR